METKEFKLKKQTVSFEVENKRVTLNLQLKLTVEVTEIIGESQEKRLQRQKIGSNFISWADDYYSEGIETKLNERIPRKEVFANFLREYPQERKFISPQQFRKKLLEFCRFKGYKFNPHRYDPKTGLPMYFDKYGNPIIDDKSGGVEYFIIGNKYLASESNVITTNNKHYENQ